MKGEKKEEVKEGKNCRHVQCEYPLTTTVKSRLLQKKKQDDRAEVWTLSSS